MRTSESRPGRAARKSSAADCGRTSRSGVGSSSGPAFRSNRQQQKLRSTLPQPGDMAMGMVVNCAAYQGGCRIADIDLSETCTVESGEGRFVWIGLHEPDQALLRRVQERFG